MINASELGSRNREGHGNHRPPADVAGAFAERVVNIAGIGTGDRVMCRGAAGAAVEAAVSAAGAHTLFAGDTGRERKWMPSRLPTPVRADAVLWAADGDRPAALAESLLTLRQHIRPGGRLVLWATPDGCRTPHAFSKRFQRLVEAAGFTSIISGPVPADRGQMVLVTGIFNSYSP